jgi:prevent-host-death family protein
MKEVSASEFKAKCLRMLDELDAEGLVITKRGKPVAKLVPVQGESLTARLYGKYRDQITIHGDIVYGTGREWRAEP